VQGRTKIYESLVKGDNTLQAGTPESFNVLNQGNPALGLDIKLQKRDALTTVPTVAPLAPSFLKNSGLTK